VAIPALIEELMSRGCYTWCLTSLGEFGPAAKSAVPTIIAILKKDSLDMRFQAVIALARIGGQEAERALLEALDGPRWQMTFCAIQALASTSPSEEARAHLKRIAAQHWFRPIRVAAEQTLAHPAIGGKTDSVAMPPVSQACEEMSEDYGMHFSWNRCTQTWPRRPAKLPFVLPERAATALETENGWYIGIDRGEFGGALLFRSKQGKLRTLIDGKAIGLIARFGDAILVAVEMRDSTPVFRVDASTQQVSQAPWINLPGSPVRFEGRADRLVAETTSGIFEVAPDGSIREGSCGSWESPTQVDVKPKRTQ
jgi:hypothetical protein